MSLSVSTASISGRDAGREDIRVWLRRRRRMKRKAAKARRRAQKARMPMTMPAIAPPEKVLWWEEIGVGVLEGVARIVVVRRARVEVEVEEGVEDCIRFKCSVAAWKAFVGQSEIERNSRSLRRCRCRWHWTIRSPRGPRRRPGRWLCSRARPMSRLRSRCCCRSPSRQLLRWGYSTCRRMLDEWK